MKMGDREEGAGGIGLVLCPSPHYKHLVFRSSGFHRVPVRTVCALGAAPGEGKGVG